MASAATPLLASARAANGGSRTYGSGLTDDTGVYETKEGYVLSPQGLAGIVSGNQIGGLDAWQGALGLAGAIGCDNVSKGLNSQQLSEQSRRFGSNAVPMPTPPTLCELYTEGLKDTTIIMLLCSAIVSLILGLGIEHDWEHGWIEGVSIIVTVLIVLSVSAVTDYAKAKEFRKQQEALDNAKSVNVIRDGKNASVHPRTLVVGDIVRLEVGDIVAGDGLLVQGDGLEFDESALTGETKLVPKAVHTMDGDKSSSKGPFIISGTSVMKGSGRMLLLAVGPNSVQGKILARINEQEEGGAPPQQGDVEQGLVGVGNQGGGCAAGIRSFFTFGGGDDGADLMEKLDVLAVDIGKAGILVAALVFFVMLFSWFYGQFIVDGREWKGAQDVASILSFFITAITILVVAVPEGLPLAVTLSLAISMRRMMADNNQVKHMDSCETMGSATTICSDKTGTLTENRMTVMRATLAGQSYAFAVGDSGEQQHKDLGGLILAESKTPKATTKTLIKALGEGIILNSNPTSKVTIKSGGLAAYEGNPTECALLKLAAQLGYEAEPLRRSYKEGDTPQLDWGVHQIAFSSEKKRSAWVVRTKDLPADSRRKYRMYVKGAPVQLMEACSNIVIAAPAGSNNSVAADTEVGSLPTQPLTAERRAAISGQLREYAEAGLRTLALGYRDFYQLPKGGWSTGKLVEGCTLLGVVGIEDPLRASVPGAIARCRKAGVDVRMCTGDALPTAIAISKGCGILRSTDMGADGRPKAGFAMTGAQFDEMVHLKDPSLPKAVRRVFDPESNDGKEMLAEQFLRDDKGNKVLDQEAFDRVWPTLRVLARCQPEDKLTLVRGMRSSRVFADEARCAQLRADHSIEVFPDFQVVAVTGDGTNDAPALKNADVGFAMGIAGTETAKQACDVILLDDNFTSIVQAVLWGRNVFDSISKFIQFQLTVNVVAITLAVVGAFYYNTSPLSATQMLWVNLIMDSLASIALATELPTEELLERQPYGKRRSVISGVMLANIIGQGLYQCSILLWVLFSPQTLPILHPAVSYEPKQGSLHWSLFFNVFVVLQLCNEFNSRRLQDPDKLKSTWSEWNVFQGVLTNPLFVAVMAVTILLQGLIVEFGGAPFNLKVGGLNQNQWLFCIVFGVGGFAWQMLINVVIVLFIPSTADAQAKDLKAKRQASIQARNVLEAAVVPSEEKALRSRAKWQALQHGVRHGRVYAKAFNTSLRSGINLSTLARTSQKSKLDRNLSVALAKSGLFISMDENDK